MLFTIVLILIAIYLGFPLAILILALVGKALSAIVNGIAKVLGAIVEGLLSVVVVPFRMGQDAREWAKRMWADRT